MLAVLALLLAAAPPSAVLESLNKTVRLHDVIISRDGARVAWVEQVPTPDGPAPEQSFIQVRELKDGAQPVRVTAVKAGGRSAGALEEARDEDQLAFSPDGQQLAFLSDAEKVHQPQLYVSDLRSGQVRQLTPADGHLE